MFQFRVPPRAFRAVIAIALAAISCVAPNAASAEPLRLSVARTPLSLPLYIAVEKGYFTAEGLDVRVTDCTGGHRCLKQVLDGQTDIATASDLPIVLNSFERSDYAVLGTMVTSSDDNKLIAHARSGISKPMHLAGKRLAAIPGSSSQYFLELYLLTVGIDPRQVTFVDMQPEEMAQALLSGRVDAVAVWEPFAYLTARAQGSDAVVLPNASNYLLTFNLVAHRRVTGTRDADIVGLLRAVERAERFIAERPDDAKVILRERLKLDQGFIDWVWAGMNFRLGLDQSLITRMEGEARWARRSGHVADRPAPNYLGLVHAAPLATAKPGAVRIAR